MDIEEIIKKFVALASKETLSKAEHEEARQLMQQLKEEGMTNEQISKLSKGKWTSSTIKFYTPGIKPTHPTPWDDAVSLLDKLIASGFTLDDVETAVIVAEDLKSAGVSLDNIVSLLIAVDSSSMKVADMIHQYELLKEHSLTPKNVSEALSLKEELEKMGLGLNSLVPIVELAKNYGELEKVLEALSTYASLKEVEENIAESEKRLENIHKEIMSADQKLKETKDALAELAEPLAAYKKALSLGFNEKQLDDLGGLAKKYGGPEAVFQVVKGYVDYIELTDKITEAESNLNNLETRISELDLKYSHLKSAVAMCDSLLKEHQFGLDGIVTILSIAEKYGQPMTVLKALDKYGSCELLSDKNYELEGQVQEKEKLLHQLEGQYQAVLEQIEPLNAIILKVGVDVAELKSKLAGSKLATKMISFVNNPESASYVDYGYIVVVFANAILEWVRSNRHNFESAYSIDTGLKSLIKELGGD